MSSSVIPFRKKVDAVGWRPDELSECYRVVGLLARSGLPVSIDSGLTDEGEPWAIVLREDTGDVLLHMARLDGSFVVVSAAGPVAQRGESLRAVLDTAVQTGGLAMLTRRSAAADSEILRLHPTTLIAAFIAAAWVHTETSQADLLQASSRREEGSVSRTDEARLAGFAVQPPSAALATAAASFAAVAAALDVAQADPVLEVTSEDFVQAALGLLVTTNPEAPLAALPVGFAPIEFANLELQQGTPVSSSAMMDEAAPQGAPPDSVHALQRIDTATASIPSQAVEYIDILNFSIQQQNIDSVSGLAWSADIRHALALHLPGSVEFAPAEEAESLVASAFLATEDEAPTGHLTADILAPVRASLIVTPPLLRDGEDSAVARAKLSVASDEAGLRLSHSVDTLTLIFKSAAQILHLGRSLPSTDPDAAASAEKNSSPALSPAMSTEALQPVSKGADGEVFDKSASAVSSASDAPVTQAASLPPAAPSDSDVSGPSKSVNAAVQPPPPRSNAQLLLELTTGTDHVVRVDPSSFTTSLSGLPNIGEARKAIVFDAPWLETKSFMLMPGVMMMEDDLIGGVNRAALAMHGNSVSLDLGDGLTLTLLGVVDLGLT